MMSAPPPAAATVPRPDGGRPGPDGADGGDKSLAALLTQASQLIAREFDETVRAEGYTVLQSRVLALLTDGRTMSISEVSDRTATTQPTVSRVVDELCRLGLVERTTDPADRRISRLRLTGPGRETAAHLISVAHGHEAAVLAAIGTPVAKTLKRALQHLISARRRTGHEDQRIGGGKLGAAPGPQ